MGVDANPAESSADRIAATRPSIMSLGAMMSQPASASETAVSAISGSEASLLPQTSSPSPPPPK
jgi:hypothetical protein